MKLNQTQLQYRLNLFIKNGRLDDVQAILAPIGYGPEALAALAERLQAWQGHRSRIRGLLAAQMVARQIRDDARRVARIAATKFKKTARRIFKGNEPVLTRLGLYTAPRSRHRNGRVNGTAPAQGNGSDPGPTPSQPANGSGSTSNRPSNSLAAVIDRWQMTLGAALDLEEHDLARLALRGWPIEEIQAAFSLVETLVETDLEYQKTINAYNREVTAASQAAAELHNLYLEARALTLLALEDLPPDKQSRLKRLLGL